MSNSADTKTEAQTDESQKSEQKSFTQTVNEVAGALTYNKEKNVYDFPEGEFPEEVKIAVLAEKRRRDTESKYSKSRHRLKAVENENAELRKRLAKSVQVSLSPDEQQELNTLKYEDPDAWRVRMNELEFAAQSKLNEDLTSISSTSTQQAETERRAQVLEEFKNTHDGFEFTDEMLQNDIPPRITKKLEQGEISFEDFLDKSYAYLQKGKVFDTKSLETQPNLGKVGGGSTPSEDAMSKDIVGSYTDDIY